MNKVLEEDFQYILKLKLPLERMENKTVLITGGTGFLGSLLIRFFDYINEKQNRNIRILAFVRDEGKAERVIGDCNAKWVIGDICKMPEIPEDVDFIFHCAAVTNSREMIEKPVEVAEGIVLGTYNIMKLAQKKRVEGVVFLSSMEVYGASDNSTVKIDESYMGPIDPMKARSCYPLGKRMAENICYSYHSEYGVPVKVVRLAQTFGAGVLKSDGRVFSQFAKSVMNKEDIILHTDGLSMGNYCYSADAISGLLFLLLKGENGQAYNIVNEEASMSIRDMAQLVCEKISKGAVSIRYDIPEENNYGYAAPSRIKLSSEKIKKLGWKPAYGMEDMYKRMIGYWKEEFSK